jgi:hypothetical protein
MCSCCVHDIISRNTTRSGNRMAGMSATVAHRLKFDLVERTRKSKNAAGRNSCYDVRIVRRLRDSITLAGRPVRGSARSGTPIPSPNWRTASSTACRATRKEVASSRGFCSPICTLQNQTAARRSLRAPVRDWNGAFSPLYQRCSRAR